MDKTLNEWLDYLESLHPLKMDLGLERVSQVARRLNVLQLPMPVITVAGTNGKGSCVAFLESILVTAGYQVGAYTSPHIFHFNERIRLNQTDAADSVLIKAFEHIDLERQEITLTYFEFTFLAALLLFKQAHVDVIVLEVGLGGRLDAVNCINPTLPVITTIALDHTDRLGNTRDQIAVEKAGIFRDGIDAVCGDFDPPQSLLDYAKDRSVKLFCMNRDFSYEVADADWSYRSTTRQYEHLPKTTLPVQNAATALQALDKLAADFPLLPGAVRQGLRNASLRGRYQKVGQCIFDVAHNPAAAKYLALQLQQDPNKGHTIAVVAMMKDKLITDTLKELVPLVDVWYVASVDVERSASTGKLLHALQEIGAHECYNGGTVKAALGLAQMSCKRQANQKQDRIVVFGSFYTVCEGLQAMPSDLVPHNL